MAIKNSYGTLTGGMSLDGADLKDLVSGNSGVFGGVTPPVFTTNKYLAFTGGNGESGGDRGRCVFTRSDFDYIYSSSFSYIAIYKSTKADPNTHTVFATRNYSYAGGMVMQINSAENINSIITTSDVQTKTVTNGNGTSGKWIILVFTYSENNPIVYINGVATALTGDNLTSGNFYMAESKAVLGAHSISSAGQYNRDLTGDICYFSNSNSVLSVADVANTNNEFLMLL